MSPEQDQGAPALTDCDLQGARRCGFAAVLGAPNVGKSTLVNRLVGSKVSIVSPKVQTTRARVVGIALRGESQILLVDTPGLFAPRGALDRVMVAAAWEAAAGADLIVFLVDSTRGPGEAAAKVAGWLAGRKRRATLVLNKIDAVEKSRLLALAKRLNDSGAFAQTFMVSALTGDGVDDLSAHLAAAVPPGPWLYPDDEVSDTPAALLAAEITREKLFWCLQQELPYSVAVETDSWTRREDGSVRIEQTVWVARTGQRGIVIGQHGTRIKQVSEQARTEMQTVFDCRVHLFLYVKVREKWQEDPAFWRLHGLQGPRPAKGR